MAAHIQAVQCIHNGELGKARDLLTSAIAQYGDNVDCLRDLACCFYQLGEITHWRRAYNKLYQDLQELEPQLSLKTRVDGWVCLAKFFEEEGHIFRALSIYRKYTDLFRSQEDTYQYLRLLPQLVRIESQLDSRKDLGQLYSELIRLKGADLTEDLDIEIQHGLMLAELALVGPSHAWIRLENILNRKDLNVRDKNLLLFDYLEEALLQGLDLPVRAQKAIEEASDLDSFEEELKRVYQDPQNLPLDQLTLMSSELSWAGYLRLLILWMKRCPASKEIHEIKNKINLILSSFEADSRTYWLSRIRYATGQVEVRLVFDPHSRQLFFQDKSLDLSKKKGMQTLVTKLAERPQQSVDDMISALWGTDFSPEHYHRLRMTVHRLNRLMDKLTSVPKCIEVSSERVALSHELKLFLSENSPELRV